MKQRLDFPFEKRIKTTDRLPTMQGKQSVETSVRFSISHKNSNSRKIAYNAKIAYKVKKLLKHRLDFPFEKIIETTHRLPTMEGQKIDETTVRFST